MKKIYLICLLLALVAEMIAQPLKNQRLKVSENGRFIVYEDGSPFFWLGDTAWELFHRLNREDAEKYLKNRSEKGFTVIQAVALAEDDGLRDPNPYGQVPLIDMNPSKPNEEYFKHVDYIIDLAAKYNLIIALLPTWGDKVDKMQWGRGPAIFDATNIKVYGEWIGKRYKDKTNIIWINGGDRKPEPNQVGIWNALGEGIIAGVGDKDKALITFHPPGGNTSSTWFHKQDWLDFNMMQTGHCRDVNVYERIATEYALVPTKPVLDGEPIYEDHPVCFNPFTNGYSTDTDIRKSAYWGVFAGGFGHTYGCHDIWQMYEPSKMPLNGARRYWHDALDLPGASQMKHLKNLMLSRPYVSRVPDQSLVNSTTTSGPEYIVSTRDQSGSYAFIYLPVGNKVNVNLSKLSGSNLKGYWYNPRNGEVTPLTGFPKKGTKEFTPPSSGKGNDWVLVLDDASKSFGMPGIIK